MSRTSVTLEVNSTVIFRQAVKSAAAQYSITIQNPPTNSGTVEIAWDDVDTVLGAGQGIVLSAGDRITLSGLPVNASGNVGIVGISTAAPPKAVRVIIVQPTL